MFSLKSILLSVCFTLLLFHIGKGQTTELDQLRKQLSSIHRSEEKIELLLNLSYKMSRIQPAVAHLYAEQAATMADSLKLISSLANAYSNMGDCKIYQGEYKKARAYYENALQIRETLGDSLAIARSYSNLGEINYYLGNFTEALPFLLDGLRIRQKANDTSAIAHSYLLLGILEEGTGNYQAALDYYNLGLPLAMERNSARMLAVYYNYIGRAWRKLEIYDKALDAHAQSKAYLEGLYDPVGMSDYYNNMGSIFRRKGEFGQALDYFFEAARIHKELNDKEGLADGYNDIAKTYGQLGKYKQAMEYVSKALEIAQKAGLLDDVRYAYSVYQDIYAAQGDFESALEYSHKVEAIKDSLMNIEKIEQANRLKVQYEREALRLQEANFQKDQDLQEERARLVLVSLGSVLILLLAFALFSYNRYRMKNRVNRDLEEKNEELDLERRRSDALLLNILPEETADELKRTGKAKPRSYKEVSVLFCDFKGFTKISERLSPEELIAELDYCFKAFDDIMEDHGIEKIKTIGDSYMAAAGLPLTNDHHALDAVHAAVEMQSFLKKLKEERQQEGNPSFEARIGIHTGPVIAGVVGSKKFAYDIWGDTVNTASRLETAGQCGKVNISQSTYDWIKEDFECTHRGKIEAKNKGEIDMYYVEHKK
jgi:class 3 adenylate cyclase/Tfp pilus assembly protein PilF